MDEDIPAGEINRSRMLLVALVMGLDDETLETLLERSAWVLELVRHELAARKAFDKVAEESRVQ